MYALQFTHLGIELYGLLYVNWSLIPSNLPNALRSPEVVLLLSAPPVVILSVALELPVAVTVTKTDATALLGTPSINVESGLLSSLYVVCSESVLSSIGVGISVLATRSRVVVAWFVLKLSVLAIPVKMTVSDNSVTEFPSSIVVLLTSLLLLRLVS